MRLAAALLLATLPLAACSTVKDAAVGPSLSPSAYPVTPQERRPDLGMLPSQAEISPAAPERVGRGGGDFRLAKHHAEVGLALLWRHRVGRGAQAGAYGGLLDRRAGGQGEKGEGKGGGESHGT